jgi:hypothetical protein
MKAASSYTAGHRSSLGSNDYQYGREDYGKWTFHVDVI